ncbi:conserved hypothetical protein [Gammaproteobacteria bacterium]
MLKDSNGFVNGLDPAVAALISKGGQAKKERGLPRAERAKSKRAAQKQEARNGSRAVYDLDKKLIDAVKQLAEENETTASQVAAIALQLMLRGIQFGEVDLAKYKRALPKNPRYGYELVFDEK